MNITEATNVQNLLAWLTDRHLVDDQGADVARQAAETLAAASHQRLGAGLSGADVAARWSELLTACAGCPTCQPESGDGPRTDSRPASPVVAGGVPAW